MLPPTSPSFHEQLKLATQSIHDALHTHPLLRRLMEPGCSLADYRAAMHGFHRFYSLAEARFTTLEGPKFNSEAPVLVWLNEDLHTISGGNAPEVGHLYKDNNADFPSYLGYLYVKQGSTLGGQVLCRTLSKSVGLAPDRGLRFFSGYGEHTRQNWLHFLRYLDSHSTTTDKDAAVASACDWFQTLEVMLNQS